MLLFFLNYISPSSGDILFLSIFFFFFIQILSGLQVREIWDIDGWPSEEVHDYIFFTLIQLFYLRVKLKMT